MQQGTGRARASKREQGLNECATLDAGMTLQCIWISLTNALVDACYIHVQSGQANNLWRERTFTISGDQ